MTDDESPSTGATLSVSPTEVREGEVAGRTVTVTATLNRAVLQQDTEVTVSVTTGDDFSVTNIDNPLTIAEGDLRGMVTFTLTPVNDDIDEPNERLTVSGTAAALADGVESATLTLRDNDDPPTLARLELLEPLETRISENGGTATVTAVLSNPSSVETVVGLTVPVGAEAVELGTTTLPIPAEATSGTVTLTGVDKAGYGSHRTVTLRGRVTGSTVRRDVSLTVLDDDPPTVGGGKAEVNVIEGNREVDTYTAADPAGVRLVWAVDDATNFAIDSNGRLRFQADPDHETHPSYSVTVEATGPESARRIAHRRIECDRHGGGRTWAKVNVCRPLRPVWGAGSQRP